MFHIRPATRSVAAPTRSVASADATVVQAAKAVAR